MPRYKELRLQQHFDMMLTFARDDKHELFTADGGQRRAAGHRNAFWNGFNGKANLTFSGGTFAYVAFYAGRKFAKECARCSGCG